MSLREQEKTVIWRCKCGFPNNIKNETCVVCDREREMSVVDLQSCKEKLEEKVKEKSEWMYPDQTAYLMNESVQVISTDFVLTLLADFKKACVIVPQNEYNSKIHVSRKKLEDFIKKKYEYIGQSREQFIKVSDLKDLLLGVKKTK